MKQYWHITLFAVQDNPSAIPADKREKRAEFSIDATMRSANAVGLLIEILEGYQVWQGFKMELNDKPLKDHHVTDYSDIG